jgi:adenylate cyclase
LAAATGSTMTGLRKLRRLIRRFGIARALCLGLLFGLASLRIADPPVLEEIRLRTFDLFQLARPREKTVRPIAIIDIDEASLAKYGQFPWPRTRIAELISRLTQLGAVVIAFDIVFPEIDRLTPAIAADGFAGLDEDTRSRLRALPANDELLAQAMRRARVVLGESGRLLVVGNRDDALPSTPFAMLGGDPQPYLVEFPGVLRNIAVLEQAAAGHGLFSIRTERDGMVRRVPMIMVAQGALMPSLSLEMLRVATGTDTLFVKSDPAGIRSVAVKGFEIPTDRNAQIWVHFARRDPSIYISAADVLEGKADATKIARKMVLVGTSAVGLLDLKTTPVDPAMPGVEVHAQVLESALTRSVLSQPSYAIVAELGAAMLLGLMVIWLAPLFGPLILIALGAALAALLIGTSWYFYVNHRLLIDFTYPLLSTTLIYLTLIFANFVREQKQRRQIRFAFGQYLSPTLVEHLAQAPEKLVLGGEERVMTIMFSDVRGFTAISETYKNDPRGLTTLMNRLLTPLTNAVIERKGTIDKYMGDAVMAFWNAPLDDASQESNACHAALDMLDSIVVLNRSLEDEAAISGRPYMPIDVGIGLNTGACVVGNMGSNLRFDYSVLGDPVNLASRLQSQSKTYGFRILAGSRTAQAVKDEFALLEIDFVAVKGKTEPEVIYAIVGRQEMANSADFQGLRNLTIAMLADYRDRNWTDALATIAQAREADAAGTFAALLSLYEKRIWAFQIVPPPADWNGVERLLAK